MLRSAPVEGRAERRIAGRFSPEAGQPRSNLPKVGRLRGEFGRNSAELGGIRAKSATKGEEWVPFSRRRQRTVLRRQACQERVVDRSAIASRAWWGHVVRHSDSCLAAAPILWRHQMSWRIAASVVEGSPATRERHPCSNWQRLPNSFAFYESQLISIPLDREAHAASRQCYAACVVNAVRVRTIVGRARGPKRPAANEPGHACAQRTAGRKTSANLASTIFWPTLADSWPDSTYSEPIRASIGQYLLGVDQIWPVKMTYAWSHPEPCLADGCS